MDNADSDFNSARTRNSSVMASLHADRVVVERKDTRAHTIPATAMLLVSQIQQQLYQQQHQRATEYHIKRLRIIHLQRHSCCPKIISTFFRSSTFLSPQVRTRLGTEEPLAGGMHTGALRRHHFGVWTRTF